MTEGRNGRSENLEEGTVFGLEEKVYWTQRLMSDAIGTNSVGDSKNSNGNNREFFLLNRLWAD